MKDPLISFETAKLAFDKGFYITNYIDKGLCGNIVQFYNEEGELKTEIGYEEDCCEPIEDEIQLWYPSPTQSLLQKWLREEHNIKVYCLWYDDGGLTEPRWSVYAKGPKTKDGYVNGNPSYEGILEEGLQAGLKLIK